GTLTMSDADTVLAIGTGEVKIGDAGTGALTVQNGAILDAAANDVTAADEEKSTGTLTVTGTASELMAGTLTLASAGTGALTVSIGASLSVANDFILGEEAAGKGTATITDAGSRLSVAGDTTIGGGGKGTLVGDGAALDLGNGQVTLGEEANSKGILTINGGTLALLGELLIGDAGSGTVLFGLGAKLAPGGGSKTPDITLAEKVGATGSLTIAGSGSSVSAAALEVGALGKATVSIGTSGKLLALSADIATAASTNNNSVSVNTAGVFSVTTDLSVGENGFGTLNIKGAGQVAAAGEVSLGEGVGAIGSVTVSGSVTNTTTHKTTASGLGFGDVLEIGGAGSGLLFIQQGALVAPVPAGKGVVEIAAEKGSTGKVTLSDAGSTLKGSELAVGGTAATIGGAGNLSIGAGSIASFATATIWSTGNLSDAGTLTLAGAIGGNGALTIASGGVLNLAGTGVKTISVGLIDSGAVNIEAGKAEFERAVAGTGAFTVDAKAVLQFDGSVAKGLNIDFAGTQGGELLLLDSRQFAGGIHGFGGKSTDAIDLRDIGFGSGKFTLRYIGNTKSGVLKVGDGSHTGSLTMFGDYKKANFHASTDHAGGTLIVDPPTRPALLAFAG
ncbi:MAG: beta strand repeat-containing protein, partial [Stellaceae bacterium]